MGVKEEVLRTLRTSAEEYISGQALADGLGVSRHAVWKAIDGLRGGLRDRSAHEAWLPAGGCGGRVERGGRGGVFAAACAVCAGIPRCHRFDEQSRQTAGGRRRSGLDGGAGKCADCRTRPHG